MYFQITVKLHGEHFFTTDAKSLTNGVKMLRVYNQLKKRFLRADGFQIIVQKFDIISELIDADKMMA